MTSETHSKTEERGFETSSIHGGQESNPLTGAVVPGIELATTYQQSSPGINKGFEYSRTGNPTRKILENLLSEIENGKYGTCFASGSATTVTLVQSFLKTGDHLISIDDVYGGTGRYFRTVGIAQNGITVSFLDLTETTTDPYKLLEKEIQNNPKTRILWMETPTNPMLKVADIKKLCDIARKYNVISIIDNTFATPYNQQPLDLGCDIVCHSITKYLNGHSDVVMGCCITNNKKLDERIKFMQNTIGAVPSPFDCYLVIRGIKTLPLRMIQHAKNALAVAQYLESQTDTVERVYYPFLRSHPNYKLAKKQMKTGGGMVSFLLKGGLQESKIFLQNCKLMKCAESLGAVETLIEHPAIMTHASVPPELRLKIGILDNLIRISVGCENINDIFKDLDNALNAVRRFKRNTMSKL